MAIQTALDSISNSTSGSPFGFKNRIINGAMVIDQRNAGASVNCNSATNPYTLDRWRAVASTGSGQYSVQQNAGSVTPPAGFTNYLGITSLAATSVGTNDYFNIRQPIEGLNVADLGWGTANAKTVTLSFWVRSSLTGTFSVSLMNGANTRGYPATYTISSANTWEYKTITIAGDTTGTWLTNTNIGIDIFFNLGAGSGVSGTANSWDTFTFPAGRAATGATQVLATNGATFYITGVQLEKGTAATSFDYRPYGTELALCQRYYQLLQNAGGGRAESATYVNIPFRTIGSMRSAPTGSLVGTIQTRDLTAGANKTANTPSSLTFSIANDSGGYLEFGASSWSAANYTVGNLIALACATGINGIALSSEL
jgi:hypothetical protein